ncbi:hypothetical protein ACGFNY_43920 [Streptomyces chartreusis]|uniref:hypothetical protein n=1 Tax=Streptomyces chartreusis TaxID=1969 RepID=UPI003717633C
MSTPTTSYGHPLTPGDEIDLNDTPVCCNDMTGADTGNGGRDYTCPNCHTVLSISPNGLVDDIHEEQTLERRLANSGQIANVLAGMTAADGTSYLDIFRASHHA